MLWENQRAKKDFFEIVKMNEEDGDNSISLMVIDNELDHFHATIDGPTGTPYATGKFALCVRIPKEYPTNPPRVTFKTKVWHPNVLSRTGDICLDVLSERWSSQLSLRTLLISIQALLSAPEADDAFDLSVGVQCKNYPDIFNLTAQVWTNIYAEGNQPVIECDEKIRYLLDLGVPRDYAVDILSCCNWHMAESIRTATQLIVNGEFNDD